jgi:rubrerythrin
MSAPAAGVESIVLRNELADLLAEAAVVEHDVLCQYLFAAASLKQHHAEGGVTYAQLELMRGWKTTIMEVARQEMEHLGIVSNLLTAIGEAPRFDRPDFPVARSILPIDQDSLLRRFSDETILRFVCFEMPAEPPADDITYLRTRIAGFDPASYDAIYRLYTRVAELLGSIPEDELFIGRPRRSSCRAGTPSPRVG